MVKALHTVVHRKFIMKYEAEMANAEVKGYISAECFILSGT